MKGESRAESAAWSLVFTLLVKTRRTCCRHAALVRLISIRECEHSTQGQKIRARNHQPAEVGGILGRSWCGK